MKKFLKLILALCCCGLLIYGGLFLLDKDKQIERFAEKNGLDVSDYPYYIVNMYHRNSETKDFVLNYPLDYGKEQLIDLSEYANSGEVPLFLQWDRRWGYMDYGSSVAGLTACGPVSLSMAGFYLSGGDERFYPNNVIKFAIDEGYCVPGSGSAWSLIYEGGERLGLDVEELPLSESLMAECLQAGKPIICIMGPGDFTSDGHFVVLSDYENGKFKVNDPNSRRNSKKMWSYEDISYQIQNMWVLGNN